ncbi:MAG: Fic family protein [Gemmatimonadales bacterium]
MPGHYISEIWQSNPTIYAPAKHRRACRYESFIPDELGSLAVNFPADVAGLASEADGAIRALNTVAQPALAPLARLLLRTEAIASSKVEGLQMGVRELARAEARMETGGRRSQTAAEVLANVAAMETAISEAAAVPHFGTTEIQEIHRRLMEHDANPRTAGQLRTTQNWIGGNDYNPCGADFVPPPVEELPRLLDDLWRAVNDDLLPPVVQAALVHAQFETIHPFDDGNGRTGRALIHVVLRRRGVAPSYVPPISVVLAAARDRYIAGLTAFRGDGVVAWIEQFAAAAAKSAHLAQRYLSAVEGLMAEWRDRLIAAGAPRSDAAAWAIIDVLPAHPIITGPVAAAATGRSKGSVYDGLAQLQEAGVLVPLSQGARNQSWEADGLLDLLEELEAGGLAER